MERKQLSEAEMKDLQTSNAVIREIISAKLPIQGLKAELERGGIVLRGKAPDRATRDRAVALASRVPGIARVDDRLEIAGEGATPAAGATYTVKQGDTLSEIAERELGAASRWKEIFEANRGSISDPNRIGVGQKLKLPSK
jgi:nucleoid-associated protein YgaU